MVILLKEVQLINVNKARYRSHLKYVIIACIVLLAAGSLLISQLFIALFPNVNGSHFHWNLSGVVVTSIFIAWCLNKSRHHPFMTEVVYVWELKQALNKITRKMRNIKKAADQGDVNALTALQFSYAGSRLLWKLDDNAIVMDELAVEQLALDKLLQKYQLSIDPNHYTQSMLDAY